MWRLYQLSSPTHGPPTCYHVERKARVTRAALVELGLLRRTEAGWADVLTDQMEFVVAEAAAMDGSGPRRLRRLLGVLLWWGLHRPHRVGVNEVRSP